MSGTQTVNPLIDGNARQRLAAARVLQRSAGPEDVPILQAALEQETVEWTRLALTAALERALRAPSDKRRRGRSMAVASPSPGETRPDELSAQIRDQITHETSMAMVHLLDPIIGSVLVYASREVPNFPTSDTSRAMDRLVEFAQSVRRLGRASASAVLSDVDVAAVVASLRISEFAADLDRIDLRGPQGVLWTTDAQLVSMILSAGLRNALEASDGLEGRDRVVCEWTVENDALVIRVVDSGSGLGNDIADPFESGKTTKPGHSGLGLAIARQAVRSLDATLSLRPVDPSGAVFELTLHRMVGAPDAPPESEAPDAPPDR